MATLIIKLGLSKSKKKIYIIVTFQNRHCYSFQYVSSFCCTSCCYVFATHFISEKKKINKNKRIIIRISITDLSVKGTISWRENLVAILVIS